MSQSSAGVGSPVCLTDFTAIRAVAEVMHSYSLGKVRINVAEMTC